MSFKIKQEKMAPEIETARSKLDGALQTLIDKAEESTSSSDESDDMSPEIKVKEETAQAPPSKKAYRKTQRKRKPKEDSNNKNSYILKLFDRSVDLAQFHENTPLYPVCRAWIRNKPYSTWPAARSRSPTPEPHGEESQEDDSDDKPEVKNIYTLPLPLAKQSNKDLRVPSPIPQQSEVFSMSSEDDGPSREVLLSKHMIRWRAVRQKWKVAALANEERYKESSDILKVMFAQSLRKVDRSPAFWDEQAIT